MVPECLPYRHQGCIIVKGINFGALIIICVFSLIVQDGSIKPVLETPSVIAERLEESEIQV